MHGTRTMQQLSRRGTRRTNWMNCIALIAFVTAIPLTHAQDATAPPAAPPATACTTDAAPYRDFDFWLGHWDVFDVASGTLLGENRIERLANGCLITEHWRGVRGSSGFSMNFYDPNQRAWRQVWQSADVLIDYSGSREAQGAMQLEGTITYHGDGRSAPFRGRWTPQPDGRVLQEFWEFNAEQEAWTVWFRGEYRRRENDGSAVDTPAPDSAFK